VRTSARFVLSAALLLGALAPRAALANGRFPKANQLTVTPGKPEQMVLRTTFGVVFSNDRGAHWKWVCEQAVGYGGEWDPPIGVMSSGMVLAGTIDGLTLSPDHGCAWNLAENVRKRAIIDVVVRANAPNEGFALASAGAGEDDAGAPLFKTEIFGTADDGKSWTAANSPFDATFVAETIDVAASDPKRMYVSGSSSGNGVLYVSVDGGAAFEKRDVPLDKPKERNPFVAAVDPKNADRIYVRTNGTTSRLLVSDDAGKTYRPVFSGPPLVGFALSPDGSRVWVGSNQGLSGASTTDFAFEKLNDSAIECLFAVEDRLYECVSDAKLSFILGQSIDGGRTFSHVLGLSDVEGPLACPSDSTAAQCVAVWPTTKDLIDPLGVPADAGAESVPGVYKATGGCSAAAAPIARFGVPLLALGAVFAALRARRRSR
jgi:photosystem II stability/assembly factor-like uncharacterized protein